MVWQQIVLISYLVFSLGVTVAMVGRPRKPLDGPTVFVVALLTAVLIALIATI
jgi:heptaprenylglyceryl phosphate synthase